MWDQDFHLYTVDDYLKCSPSREHAVRDTTRVVDHLSKHGFRINLDCCSLQCGHTDGCGGTEEGHRPHQLVASRSGWGAVHEGRAVNGFWSLDLHLAHINYLELLAVFLALRHFLPFLQGYHILVRTDKTTVVGYINRQGGTHSFQLHWLAHRLLMWSNTHLLSLRVTYIPGVLNRGADLLSRGNPLYGEWRLHPQVVEQIRRKYG